MRRKIAKKLGAQSDFTKNVMRLAGSSAAAIVITLLSLPIITRIYSPEEFGQFQILVSTVGMLSVITSFRYELAIVLPKRRAEASAVYTLALIFLMITTLVILLAFFFFGSVFLELLNAEVLEPYLFLMCVAIFLAGSVQVFRYAITREKRFKELGSNRVIESSSSQGMKIGLGLISPTFISLFISQVSGYVLSIILLVKYKKVKLSFSKLRLRWALRKYRKFIIYNTPAILINTVALQLPVFMIARYFGPELVGFYVLAIKLIEVPLKVIGNAISQVYFKEAADLFNTNSRLLLNLYRRTVAKLSLIMIIPTFAVLLLAEPIVPLILGDNWAEVGEIMMFLIIWKSFEFINYPVSTTLTIINEQHIDLVLKAVLSLGLRFLVLVLFHETQVEFFVALVVSASLYYIAFNLIAYQRVKRLI